LEDFMTLRTRLFLAAVCLAILLATTGCSSLVFRSPIEPFATTPNSAKDLVKRYETLQKDVTTLESRMDVVLKGKDIQKKQKFELRLRYRKPDGILLNGHHRVAGDFFWISQLGDRVGIYIKDEKLFYHGTTADLDAHPAAFYGLRPVDLVRAFLVNEEVLGLLQKQPNGALPTATATHWSVSADRPGGQRETYTLRRRDGLVDKIEMTGPDGSVRFEVDYRAYDLQGADLFPSRFRVRIPATNTTLDVTLERLQRDMDEPDERFPQHSLNPEASELPLKEWLSDQPLPEN
jgi:hypothetical protein